MGLLPNERINQHTALCYITCQILDQKIGVAEGQCSRDWMLIRLEAGPRRKGRESQGDQLGS